MATAAPPAGPRLCQECGNPMDPVVASLMASHPGCYGPGGVLPPVAPPQLPTIGDNPFGPPPPTTTKIPMTSQALALRAWVLDMIRWKDDSSARSQQVHIGPSEIGTACARQLAYKIVGTPKVNTVADPWPAIQGTAIHAWLADAMKAFAVHKGWTDVLVEFPSLADAEFPVGGTSDCYHDYTIIDWKAQPLDEPILTPNGWVPMGTLRVGDEVIGSDGKPTAVVGVYPQGMREVYVVSTQDAGTTRATSDHLWTVQRQYQHEHGRRTITVPTDRLRKGDYLPTPAPIWYDKRGIELPLDPYALGLLLGDGGLRGESIKFTNSDGLEKYIGFPVTPDKNRPIIFRLAGAVPMMKELGLHGLLSVDKHIPDCYLYAPDPADRLALLQGLMDTDGHVHRFNAKFSTSSDRLARDVVTLVHSLGGEIHDHVDSGLRKGATRLAHLMSIKLPEGMCPFRADIPMKRGRWAPGRPVHRCVRSVAPDATVPVQCIKVTNPDGLYVTRDFILTHNTAGKDALAEVTNHGIPTKHRVQVNTYGLGARHRGVEVRRVALVYLPRGGRLQDTYVVVEEFQPEIALEALERLWRIDNNLKILDIRNHPELWDTIPATPDRNCAYCDFFVASHSGQVAATDRSCPGQSRGEDT